MQHERAPRNTSSLVAAARRTPSGLYTGIPNVYHPTGSAYHPLLYPALFPFKPTVPTFAPSVGEIDIYIIIEPTHLFFAIKSRVDLVSALPATTGILVHNYRQGRRSHQLRGGQHRRRQNRAERYESFATKYCNCCRSCNRSVP